MAQEGEVVGLEPAQEVLVLREVRRPAGDEIGDGVEAGASHSAPVFDRESHFGQHACQRGGEFVELRVVGLAVDFDVHHRFRLGPLTGLQGNADHVAVEIATHRQDGVRQHMDGDLAAIELVGNRIDQERHVVVDDLNDRVAALEAVGSRGRIEGANLGDARQPTAGEGQQRVGRRQRAGPPAPRRGPCRRRDRTAGVQIGRRPRRRQPGERPHRWHRARKHVVRGRWPCLESPPRTVADVTPPHDILTTNSWRARECPPHLAFCGVVLRGRADSLLFLFLAHGFRGKARFVLSFCCTCEGVETTREREFQTPLSSRNIRGLTSHS